MVERRRNGQRRKFIRNTEFPVRTQEGKVIVSDRRRLPTRRINDIEVKELSCREFLAELQGASDSAVLSCLY